MYGACGSTRVVVEKGVGQVTGRPATEGGIGDGELNGSGLGFDHHSRCCLSSVSEEDSLIIKLFLSPLGHRFPFLKNNYSVF